MPRYQCDKRINQSCRVFHNPSRITQWPIRRVISLNEHITGLIPKLGLPGFCIANSDFFVSSSLTTKSAMSSRKRSSSSWKEPESRSRAKHLRKGDQTAENKPGLQSAESTPALLASVTHSVEEENKACKPAVCKPPISASDNSEGSARICS